MSQGARIDLGQFTSHNFCMAVAIFPNSSYFIAYGASPIFFEELRLASLRHRARVYACRSKSEFQEALSIIRVPSGLFVDGTGLNDKDLSAAAFEVAKLKLSQACFITDKVNSDFNSLPNTRSVFVQPDSKPELWRSEIDQFMKVLVPPRLEEMILDSANSIVPTFLSEMKSFRAVNCAPADADYVLNFSISAGEVIGQFLAWFKWDEICQMFPDLPRNRSSDKILDVMRESMNQCAGVLVRAIVHLHPNLPIRIGLPTGFDLTKIPKIESVKYFPSANILEEQGRMGISIGFINLRHGPLFDLSGYSSDQSGGDNVEFL